MVPILITSVLATLLLVPQQTETYVIPVSNVQSILLTTVINQPCPCIPCDSLCNNAEGSVTNTADNVVRTYQQYRPLTIIDQVTVIQPELIIQTDECAMEMQSESVTATVSGNAPYAPPVPGTVVSDGSVQTTGTDGISTGARSIPDSSVDGSTQVPGTLVQVDNVQPTTSDIACSPYGSMTVTSTVNVVTPVVGSIVPLPGGLQPPGSGDTVSTGARSVPPLPPTGDILPPITTGVPGTKSDFPVDFEEKVTEIISIQGYKGTLPAIPKTVEKVPGTILPDGSIQPSGTDGTTFTGTRSVPISSVDGSTPLSGTVVQVGSVQTTTTTTGQTSTGSSSSSSVYPSTDIVPPVAGSPVVPFLQPTGNEAGRSLPSFLSIDGVTPPVTGSPVAFIDILHPTGNGEIVPIGGKSLPPFSSIDGITPPVQGSPVPFIVPTGDGETVSTGARSVPDIVLLSGVDGSTPVPGTIIQVGSFPPTGTEKTSTGTRSVLTVTTSSVDGTPTTPGTITQVGSFPPTGTESPTTGPRSVSTVTTSSVDGSPMILPVSRGTKGGFPVEFEESVIEKVTETISISGLEGTHPSITETVQKVGHGNVDGIVKEIIKTKIISVAPGDTGDSETIVENLQNDILNPRSLPEDGSVPGLPQHAQTTFGNLQNDMLPPSPTGIISSSTSIPVILQQPGTIIGNQQNGVVTSTTLTESRSTSSSTPGITQQGFKTNLNPETTFGKPLSGILTTGTSKQVVSVYPDGSGYPQQELQTNLAGQTIFGNLQDDMLIAGTGSMPSSTSGLSQQNTMVGGSSIVSQDNGGILIKQPQVT